MKWTLFVYENGANPYITKTEKETKRILKKYNGRIQKIKNNYYYIKEETKQNKIYPLF